MAFNFEDERAAAEAAGKKFVVYGQRQGNTMTVAGFVVVDPDATPAQITDAVFEAKNGRPIDDRERLLMDLAERASAED